MTIDLKPGPAVLQNASEWPIVGKYSSRDGHTLLIRSGTVSVDQNMQDVFAYCLQPDSGIKATFSQKYAEKKGSEPVWLKDGSCCCYTQQMRPDYITSDWIFALKAVKDLGANFFNHSDSIGRNLRESCLGAATSAPPQSVIVPAWR